MSWLRASVPAPGDLTSVLGLRPELRADYERFESLIWDAVDPIVLELCRLRIAQLLRCESELASRTPRATAAGLGENKIVRLKDWPHDPGFSARERACLELAEQFVMDPHGVTDAQAASVLEHLGAPGMVALTQALAVFEGFTRLRLILGVAPAGGA